MTQRKVGILLANLGSPEAPTVTAVRRFLKDFLWDPRVVNLPRPLWWIILHGFVLTLRPRQSLKAYQKIWDAEKGSPLTYLTSQLTEKVAERFDNQDIFVAYVMRYGEPSMAKQLNVLKKQGVTDIIVLPLYPQHSSTTTASVYDHLVKELNQWRHLPSIHFISDYHQDPRYIHAVADSIKNAWDEQPKAELLLMSFHGLPEKLTQWGDPYFHQCHATAELIADRLGLTKKEWRVVFQSRFGKAQWLKPYCVETLQALPREGITSVDVVCPGFAVDCLETLEEIEIQNKELFMDAGGKSYRYIPALNDSDSAINMIVSILEQKL